MVDGPGFTSYSVDSDRIFREAIELAKEQVEDLTVPLTLITKDFYRGQRAIWKLKSAGQYPDLSKKPFFAWWEKGPLRTQYNAGYKSYKQAKYGFAYPILKATGKLEDAASNPKSPGAIADIVQKDTLILGVRDSFVPYAKFHQEGTRRMPMRKMFFIGPEAPRFALSDHIGRRDRWVNILSAYVLSATRPLQSGAA